MKSGMQKRNNFNEKSTSPLNFPISLTKSKSEVKKELQDQIDRGNLLLNELQKKPLLIRENIDEYSIYWHDWRRRSEQILSLSFTSTEPLQQLRDLTPNHLDFGKSVQYRAEKLPDDIKQEIAFLENLLHRLRNYGEVIQIPVNIEVEDALTIKTDVLVLKYADQFYGMDEVVANHLKKLNAQALANMPNAGEFLLVQSDGRLGAKEVLFVGVGNLYKFRYQGIRDFAKEALKYLMENVPLVKSVCFSTHGTGYGLDEREAFEAELAGFVDAISENNFPENLERITIVDRNEDTVKRLRPYLNELLPQNEISINRGGILTDVPDKTSNHLKAVGYASESKPLVFVAMPFDNTMYDVFNYGIRGPVNDAGYLCERIDEADFTGDIMERVRTRIEEAKIVIADLTTANPNVYLEVGYAWGCGKQTILLVHDAGDLKFDVRGQRCFIYGSISELEKFIRKELANLFRQEQ
jgi:hypothetical protein